jgi:hypothetical protein
VWGSLRSEEQNWGAFFARPLTCVYAKGFLGSLARKHCYHAGTLSRAFAYVMQKTGLSAPIFFAARRKKGFPLQSLAHERPARAFGL